MNTDRIVVNKGRNNNMNLKITDLNSTLIPVKSTDVDRVDIDITALFYFEAPVEKYSTVGTLKVLLNNEVIDIVQIYNNNEIQKKNIGDYFKEFLLVLGA